MKNAPDNLNVILNEALETPEKSNKPEPIHKDKESGEEDKKDLNLGILGDLE